MRETSREDMGVGRPAVHAHPLRAGRDPLAAHMPEDAAVLSRRKDDVRRERGATVPSLWITRRTDARVLPNCAAARSTERWLTSRHPMAAIRTRQMAAYKYAYFLTQTPSTRFDRVTAAGATSPHAGIYRCQGCGQEIAVGQGAALPASDDHSHRDGQGRVRWRLAVAVTSYRS